jgi:hypothetical protein
MGGRPENDSRASSHEYDRRLLVVGEEEQECPGERSSTRQQGQHPGEQLGRCHAPFHGRYTLALSLNRGDGVRATLVTRIGTCSSPETRDGAHSSRVSTDAEPARGLETSSRTLVRRRCWQMGGLGDNEFALRMQAILGFPEYATKLYREAIEPQFAHTAIEEIWRADFEPIDDHRLRGALVLHGDCTRLSFVRYAPDDKFQVWDLSVLGHHGGVVKITYGHDDQRGMRFRDPQLGAIELRQMPERLIRFLHLN